MNPWIFLQELTTARTLKTFTKLTSKSGLFPVFVLLHRSVFRKPFLSLKRQHFYRFTTQECFPKINNVNTLTRWGFPAMLIIAHQFCLSWLTPFNTLLFLLVPRRIHFASRLLKTKLYFFLSTRLWFYSSLFILNISSAYVCNVNKAMC